MLRKIFLLILVAAVASLASSCSDDKNGGPTAPEAGEPVVSGTLPVIYINTDGSRPIVSKEEYIEGKYWIDAMGVAGLESVASRSQPAGLQIRGRGHSSWKGSKKPYKIKLDKKTALLGMPGNKHWALLKPSENTIAGMQLGKLMGMAWTPSLQPVEVVLNDDYIGLYFLTETIRIDENRVNIYEQPDGETDPVKICGGWLVEVDNYSDDNQIHLPEGSRSITIRYHSPEDLSQPQLDWLKAEFTAVNAAVYADDPTSTEWENYFDVESMARYFILQEVMDNPDGFHGSFYLHKDLGDGSRWVAGPAWDLVCYYRDKTDYTFRMKAHYGFTPHWIGRIIQRDSFCRAVAAVWQEVYPSRLNGIYDYLDATILPLDKAWRNDCTRWKEDPTQTAGLRASRLKNALRGNIRWFDSHLPVSLYAPANDTYITSINPK